MTAVATGMVTAFATGATVTVTIRETVSHPGHYRVALSTTGMGGLPADPPVTAVGSDACGSTVIQNPPVFPVLADGMLPHTSAFSGNQTFTFTLPAGMTCTSNCVLQVIEYMSMPRGALLLSPLREHHDRGGQRHGGRGRNGR